MYLQNKPLKKFKIYFYKHINDTLRNVYKTLLQYGKKQEKTKRSTLKIKSKKLLNSLLRR